MFARDVFFLTENYSKNIHKDVKLSEKNIVKLHVVCLGFFTYNIYGVRKFVYE